MSRISIIEVKGLTKIFDNEIRAVDDISFTVEEGEILGFLGPNGAGFVGLGVAIGSVLTDFHAFQLLATFVMWPLFMLSGVFFPIDVAPFPLQVAMLFDPLFYGAELLRWCLLGSGTPLLGPFGWLISLGVLVGFTAVMVGIGTYLFSRAQV